MKRRIVSLLLIASLIALPACDSLLEEQIPVPPAAEEQEAENIAPVAFIEYSILPQSATYTIGAEMLVPARIVPARLLMWGDQSFDIDGKLVTHSWSLNGDQISTAENPKSQELNEPGEYDLTLTVEDNNGLKDTARERFVLYENPVAPPDDPVLTPTPTPPEPPFEGICQTLKKKLSTEHKDCVNGSILFAFARGISVSGDGAVMVTVLIHARVALELVSFVDDDAHGNRIGIGFQLGLQPGETAEFDYVLTEFDGNAIFGSARAKPEGAPSQVLELVSDF